MEASRQKWHRLSFVALGCTRYLPLLVFLQDDTEVVDELSSDKIRQMKMKRQIFIEYDTTNENKY